MLNKLTLFFCLLCLHQAFSKSYANYTLYRGIPINERHLEFYKNLTWMYETDFWRPPGQINRPVDFMIAPKYQADFIKDVIKQGLYLTTVMEDVQQYFAKQKIKTYIRRRTESFDWSHYFRLNDIYIWLRDLAALYPKKMKIRVLGKSHENREIISVMINLKENSRRDSRSLPLQKVIVEGGIHAREWISPAFVTYFIQAILYAPYSDDEEFKKMAYFYEWHFVPVLNPDGYEYTHLKDRMWRKNRHDKGVDLNRNFGYNFGSKGISFNKYSQTYCGETPFSENESKAMATLVTQNKINLSFYLAFHSYGQYIIIPFADSTIHQENFEEVKSMAQAAAKELQKEYGTKYSIGTAYDTVGYMTSGISGDWVKNTFNTRVVCTFELRDLGSYGFALPPHLILPTCKETMEAMKSLLIPHRRHKNNYGNEMREKNPLSDGQGRSILDALVIVCNVLLFIIVRFDYFLGFIARAINDPWAFLVLVHYCFHKHQNSVCIFKANQSHL